MEQRGKNMKSDRLKDEIFGGIAVCENIVCKTCLFAYPGDPENSSCKIYSEANGLKPHDVYFFGKKCRYYRSKEDLDKASAEWNRKKFS